MYVFYVNPAVCTHTINALFLEMCQSVVHNLLPNVVTSCLYGAENGKDTRSDW